MVDCRVGAKTKPGSATFCKLVVSRRRSPLPSLAALVWAAKQRKTMRTMSLLFSNAFAAVAAASGVAVASRSTSMSTSSVASTTSASWRQRRALLRWRNNGPSVAFAAAPFPCSYESYSFHIARRSFSSYTDDLLPWSPIAEEGATTMRTTTPQLRTLTRLWHHRPYCRKLLQLRMAPSPLPSPSHQYGTEGFRDASRGGQGYLETRGGGTTFGGGGGRKKSYADEEEVSKQQHQRHLQPKEDEAAPSPPPSPPPKTTVPFPKLTPGRKRNYRPPHVLSALLQQQESLRFDADYYGDIDDNIDDLWDIENCIENFRDGKKESAVMRDLYSSGGNGGSNGGAGPKGSGSIRRVLPQISDDRKLMNYEEQEYDNEIDDDAKSMPKSKGWGEKMSSTASLGGCDSERFRDDLRAAGARGGLSGSDVAVTMDRVGLGSLIGSSSPPPPFSSVLSLYYSSATAAGGRDYDDDDYDNDNDEVDSSMSFRDGKTRMAVFKDKAFKMRLVDGTPLDTTVEDDDDEREEGYEEEEDDEKVEKDEEEEEEETNGR